MAASDYVSLVQQFYVGFYGRPADEGGLAYWTETIELMGGSIDGALSAFANSTEAQDFVFTNPATGEAYTNAELVENIYQTLFNRAAEAEGKDFYVAKLDAGEMTLATIVKNIIDGAQGSDATAIANKVTIAEYFTENLNGATYDSDDILGARAVIATVDSDPNSIIDGRNAADTQLTEQGGGLGEVFTLTTGVDTVSGTTGNDVIISGYDIAATKQTFSALDDIDGGAGTDTLKIFDDTAAVSVPTTVSVTNVEKVIANVADDLTVDVSDWTGLNSVNAQVVGGDLALTAAATVGVTVGELVGNASITDAKTVVVSDASATSTVDILTGSATTTAAITGGLDITIDKDGAGANSTVLTSVTIDGTVGDVAIDSNAFTTLSLANLETANKSVVIDNANASGHDLSLTLDDVGYDDDGNAVANVDVDDATADAVNVTMVSDSNISLIADAATELSVAGAGLLTLNMGGADELDDTDTVETVTVSEDAGLVADLSGISSLTTVTASTSTANNDLTLGVSVTSASTGSGDDSVEFTGALAADATVTLGGGDDTFTAAAANNATSSVDAGEGTDTLALTNATFADTAAEADVYSNFETLEVGGGQGSYELDLLALTDIKISSDVAAGVVLNDAAAGAEVTATATASTDLNITTGTVEYVLEDASGTSDAVTVNLNAVDGDDDGTTTEGEVTLGEFIANDIEKVTVDSNALTVDADDDSTPSSDESTTADEYINTVSVLNGDSIKTLELTGNAQANVTVGSDDGLATTIVNTQITLVDASSNTAGVTVDMSTIDADANGANDDIAVNTTAVTFKGSDAVDTYTASHNGDIIQGNGGGDNITLSDNGTLTTATNADETVRYAAASDSQLTLTDTNDDGAADTATGFDAIINFGNAGTDILELSSALGLATGDARADIIQKGSFTAGIANLEDFIGDGADFFDTGLADRAVAFAHDGTDGYVFIDANSDGNFTQADDMFIELTGVTTLAITDISFG